MKKYLSNEEILKLNDVSLLCEEILEHNEQIIIIISRIRQLKRDNLDK